MLAAATLIMLLAAPYYLPLIASGFNAEKIDLTRRLLYILSPIVMVYGINTIWGSVLNAGERFALVAITPALTPAVITVFLLVKGGHGALSHLPWEQYAVWRWKRRSLVLH